MRWLLLLVALAALAGCASWTGVVPTEEERCGFQGGFFSNGVCHTRGGV